MTAVVRHFVAVQGGVVVGSRSTLTPYVWAVCIQGADEKGATKGWFATFHRRLEEAHLVLEKHYEGKVKVLVETIETKDRVPIGAKWTDDFEAHDDPAHDPEAHAQHAADLERFWRHS